MYVHLTLPYFLKSIEKARLGGGGTFASCKEVFVICYQQTLCAAGLGIFALKTFGLDLCKTTTRLGALRDNLISEQLLFLRRKQYQADVTLDGWHCFLFLCLCNSVRLAAGRH